jgi:hypothetical protein
MAKNKLFEAAAEILAAGKGKNAMPAEKLEGEVQVAGGPTPENAKPDDDSHKMTFTSKSATAPTTKASAASAKMEEEQKDGEVVSEEKSVDLSTDIDSLFADDSTISEEFKGKVKTIFEARVYDRVAQIEEETEAKYASMLEEAVEAVKSDLTDKVNDYIGYVVEQWMEENQIAIEKGIRSEITEDFINGLRNLFAEHYIDVPSEKVDLVDELANKLEEVEAKLDEEVERNVEYRKALIEAHKTEVTREVCEGLTATQVEKIKALAESVEFSTEEEFKQKLDTIRENYFPSGVKKADGAQLNEQVEEDKPTVITDTFMNSIVQSITKTNRI